MVTGEYELGMQDQAFLGPESGLAIPAEDGGVDLYVATQWLHVDRAQVAASLGLPPERVRIHACWGNYEGPHDCYVAMHEVLPAIGRARVGGWVLPVANPRHQHEYRCLKDLPLDDGQVVVAGVIDPLTAFVEHPEVVADRIERVAQAVGDPTRVLAGTDCGFDTSAGRGRVPEDVVWAKLAALAEGARIASRRLGLAG